MTVILTFTNHVIMFTKSKTDILIYDRKSTSAASAIDGRAKDISEKLPLPFQEKIHLRRGLTTQTQRPRTAFMVVIFEMKSSLATGVIH